MPRVWSKPTLPKATVEDADDPVLGWTAQHDPGAGPDERQAYAPWKAAAYPFVEPAAIKDPTAAPTTGTATTGGTLAASTYTYVYTWATEKGETLPSPVSSGQATTGSTSTVTVTVPARPTWARFTKVYGRTGSGNRRLVGQTTTTTLVDTGAVITANREVPTVSTALKNANY